MLNTGFGVLEEGIPKPPKFPKLFIYNGSRRFCGKSQYSTHSWIVIAVESHLKWGVSCICFSGFPKVSNYPERGLDGPADALHTDPREWQADGTLGSATYSLSVSNIQSDPSGCNWGVFGACYELFMHTRTQFRASSCLHEGMRFNHVGQRKDDHDKEGPHRSNCRRDQSEAHGCEDDCSEFS